MLTIDMSVNHVSFPLRKFRSPALCHPLKKMWYRGASPKPGNVQQRSSPQLQKVCASGQREEFNIVFFFVFVFVVFVVFVVCIVCCFFVFVIFVVFVVLIVFLCFCCFCICFCRQRVFFFGFCCFCCWYCFFGICFFQFLSN